MNPDESEAPRPLGTKSTTLNDRPDDFFEVEIGGKSARVFRPVVRVKRLKNFYVKFEISGRTIYRGLGTDAKGMAAEVAKKILRAAMDSRWEALETTKLKQRAQVTVGDVIEAYTEKIAGFVPKMRPKTVKGYCSALRCVARSVSEEDPEGVLLSALDHEEVVEGFYAGHVKTAGEDKLLRDSRMRGANSTLNQARALFGPMGLKCYRGMKMPEMEAFMTTTTQESPQVEHEEVAPATIKAIAKASLKLKEENKPLYLAHLLFRHCAARPIEVQHARREWLEPRKEVMWLPNGEKRLIAGYLTLKKRSYWEPKRNSGIVPIAPEVWAELMELTKNLQPEDFLIEAATTTDREDLVRRHHADWIRPWVEDHAKRTYELRRWASTVVARRQGDEAADRFLRHRPKSVAGKHYLTGHAPIAPISFADCGLQERSPKKVKVNK